MVHNVRCMLLFDVKNSTSEMDLIYMQVLIDGSSDTKNMLDLSQTMMPGMFYGKGHFSMNQGIDRSWREI